MNKIDRMYQYFGHGEGTCKDCSNLVTYEQSRKWYFCHGRRLLWCISEHRMSEVMPNVNTLCEL